MSLLDVEKTVEVLLSVSTKYQVYINSRDSIRQFHGAHMNRIREDWRSLAVATPNAHKLVYSKV